MTAKRILVVDDEAKMRRILEIMLGSMGHEVAGAGNGSEALDQIGRGRFDLLITDLRMPGMDGLTLLKELHARGIDLPAIVITAHGSVQTAVEAMRYGASDYILRPFEVETVELAVERALNLGAMQRENSFLRSEVERGWDEFVGRSPAMQGLYGLIAQLAPSASSVLIAGETGTGKELVARAIHRESARTGLFVPINCAAIPQAILESELFGHVRGAFTGASANRIGKFEMADRGTLFLDEITEMPVDLQAKLLRVLQQKRIERVGSNQGIDLDLRVVAASNRDPAAAVAAGQLREDLYYRLSVFRIDVPPLRVREGDIPLLARHFLASHARRIGSPIPELPDTAVNRLEDYDWPGNVRELENVMERALVLSTGRGIDPGLLPSASREEPPTRGDSRTSPPASLALGPRVEDLERSLITEALERSNGAKAKAARLLEISERSLWYKVKKYGL